MNLLKKLLVLGMLVLAGVGVCFVAWAMLVQDAMFHTPEQKRVALNEITNGVFQFVLKVDNQWDLSFESQAKDPRMLATRMRCCLKDVGRNQAFAIPHDSEAVHFPNEGFVEPNGELLLYEGELRQLLQGTFARVGGRKSTRVIIEIRTLDGAQLKGPIIVHLREYLETL